MLQVNRPNEFVERVEINTFMREITKKGARLPHALQWVDTLENPGELTERIRRYIH
ncbi:hypothetical protein GCM10027299_08790 [Larkinella ripae]